MTEMRVSATTRRESGAIELRAVDGETWAIMRTILLFDAVVSGATGAALLVGAGSLGELLDLSPTFLRLVGASLIPFVAFVGYSAARVAFSVGSVKAVIAMNLAWTIASLILLVSGWVDPSRIGYGFIIGQAFFVGLFGEVQFSLLRRLQSGERT